MNWFTKQNYVTVGDIPERMRDDMGLCHHLEDKPDQLVHTVTEHDSFGIVGINGACAECNVKINKTLDDDVMICNDCNQQRPRSEITRWEWYDFYAPQGDVPIPVCNECWDKPKHVKRMSDDARREDEEWGY